MYICSSVTLKPIAFSVKKNNNNNLRLEKLKIILLAQLVNVCSRISAYNYTTTAQADTPATHTLCNYSHHITSLSAAWAPYPPMMPHKCRLSITKLISQKLDGFKKAWICSSVTEAYCPLWWCMGGYQMPSWLPHSRWKKIGCVYKNEVRCKYSTQISEWKKCFLWGILLLSIGLSNLL